MFPAAVATESQLWMHSGCQERWKCHVHSSVVPAKNFRMEMKMFPSKQAPDFCQPATGKLDVDCACGMWDTDV